MTEDRPNWFDPPDDQQEIPDPDVASQSTTAGQTWFDDIEPSPTPPGGDQGWSDGDLGETGTAEAESTPADETHEVELSEPETSSGMETAYDGHSKSEASGTDGTAHPSDRPAEAEPSDAPAAGEEPSPSPATAGESDLTTAADTGPDEASNPDEATVTQDDDLPEGGKEPQIGGQEEPSEAEPSGGDVPPVDEEPPVADSPSVDEEPPVADSPPVDEEAAVESDSEPTDAEAAPDEEAGLSVGEESPYEPADREGLIKGTTEPTEETTRPGHNASVPSGGTGPDGEAESSDAAGADIPDDVSEKMDGWPNTEEEDGKTASASGNVPDPEPVAVSEPESDNSEDSGRSYRTVIDKIKSVFSRK